MVWALIVGLVVGIIAKFLMPGKDPGGFVITALLGVGGSLIAHFIGLRMGYYNENEPAGFVAAVIGAVILLAIYRSVTKNRDRTITH